MKIAAEASLWAKLCVCFRGPLSPRQDGRRLCPGIQSRRMGGLRRSSRRGVCPGMKKDPPERAF